MKKRYTIMLTIALIFALSACSGGSGSGDSGASDGDQGQSSEAAKAWTREGTFTDGAETTLMISPSDSEENDGWYVGLFTSEDMYGWYIPQEGDTLHGDLIPDEMGEGDFVVTVSEEGDDGVMLEVEGGETYHFSQVIDDDQSALHSVSINTEGMGQIAYAKEGNEPQFDDEYPAQSALFKADEEDTFVISAKADEGWKFVKWTQDGEDYSTDETITVSVIEEDTEFVAVFEAE